MATVTKSLVLGALLLGVADARGGNRNGGNRNGGGSTRGAQRFGNVETTSTSSDNAVASMASFFAGGEGEGDAAQESFAGRRGSSGSTRGRRGNSGSGRGGRGKKGGKRRGGMISLEKIEACEADILLACSLEFDFEMDDLKTDLATHEAAKDAHREAYTAWQDAGRVAEDKPSKPEMPADLLVNLKTVGTCLRATVKPELEEGSACLLAISHSKGDKDTPTPTPTINEEDDAAKSPDEDIPFADGK